MAHYKRGKCRRNGHRQKRGSTTSWRAKYNLKPIRMPENWIWSDEPIDWGRSRGLSQMATWPAWWDRTFHTRPKRAAAKRLERKVLAGADPDELVWPLGNCKPHIYYW